jgi:hypothetical protein
MGIMRIASPLLVSSSSAAMGLTVTAIAIAIILLASNFTIINAQQSLTSQPSAIEDGTEAGETIFQSTTDSFRVQVPEGWAIRDLNNTGSVLLEETRQGYGILARLCTEDQQQQQQPGVATASTNASGSISDNTLSCDPSENDVIHIVRYPDLDTRLLANNVTFDDNMTTDNILSYHLQKLQEVGYRSMRIVNSSDTTINVANPQTNETIATVPAKLVEMTYSTNFAPNETRIGYFISTATNATTPNPGTTKGYSVFYEGNSTNTNTTTPATAAASGSLLPLLLPPAVGQVIDSFELLAAAEVAQAITQEEAQTAETTEGGDSGANDDDDDGANDDDDDGANDDDDDGANDDDDDGANDDDDDGETSDGGISSRGDRFAGDDYDGDDDDGANDDDGTDDYDGDDDDGANDDDEFVDDDGA